MRHFSTFDDYLRQWRQVLDERAAWAVKQFAEIEGLCGLILAGSLGGGEPWPMSDIDLIPIYESSQAATAVAEVKRQIGQVWDQTAVSTGLDIGRLVFTQAEVSAALAHKPDFVVTYFPEYTDDMRWFHTLDKAYRGRTVYDPLRLSDSLVQWLTKARFRSAVVEARCDYWQAQLLTHRVQAQAAIDARDVLTASLAVRAGGHALITYLLERWGERDNSFARFGTRFERCAAQRNRQDWAERMMMILQLTPAEIQQRMEAAPETVQLRHRRSLQAREWINESVTATQDARDVLLTFSEFVTRRRPPPYDAWIAIEPDVRVARTLTEHYCRLCDDILSGSSTP